MAKVRVVTILGVGALGSHLCLLLRNMPFALMIVDNDRVERKNTQAQFHGLPATGKSKVVSLNDTLRFLFGHNAITRVPSRLEATNVDQVLRHSELVVDCFDNGASRRLVQEHVRKHNIPCLHGGLAGDGSFGLVAWDEHFTVDDEPAGGAPTCEDGHHLPFIMLVSSCLALAVQAFTENDKRPNYHISPGNMRRF